jgi:hypothetical protein
MAVPDFGDKEFAGVGFPTPASIPDDSACRPLTIPASGAWEAVVMGALQLLTDTRNWQQFEGGITPDDAAQVAQHIVDCAYEDAEFGCQDSVDTPYWDDSTDVGEDEPKSTQEWYGEVTNPDAAPEELDFVENAAIWIFTGLLAIGTAEVGAAPAILFHTIAPKFVLAMKRGDVGEIFRIVVDGKDNAKLDTTAGAAGDVMQVSIVADPSIDLHTLLVVGGMAS